MKDIILFIVSAIFIALLVLWIDPSRALDQDLGLYKKHHKEVVK